MNIEDVDFSAENEMAIAKLKEEYNQKIDILREEKRQSYGRLLFYKKQAYPKRLLVVATVCLLISLALLLNFSSFVYLENGGGIIVFSVVFFGASVGIFVLAKMRCKKRRKKYQVDISYNAQKIVECEEEISMYTKFISRLTK